VGSFVGSTSLIWSENCTWAFFFLFQCSIFHELSELVFYSQQLPCLQLATLWSSLHCNTMLWCGGLVK
jgi:hypothetical protein